MGGVTSFNILAQVAATIANATDDAVVAVCKQIQQTAQGTVAYDTGFLASSIYTETKEGSTYGVGAMAPPGDAYMLEDIGAPPDSHTGYVAVAGQLRAVPGVWHAEDGRATLSDPGIGAGEGGVRGWRLSDQSAGGTLMANAVTAGLTFLYNTLTADSTFMSYVSGVYTGIAPEGSLPGLRHHHPPGRPKDAQRLWCAGHDAGTVPGEGGRTRRRTMTTA